MQTLSGDIVECLVGIMENRPEPMRNFKPVQKIKNGLEKFWATHQERYEVRGRTSGSRVNRVNRHNAAYPKLIDELQRRGSMTRVTAFNRRKDVKLKRDPICNGCVKMRKLRGRHTKSRYHHVSSRVHKKRNRRQRNPPKFVTTASQCAYVLIKDKSIGTDAGSPKIEPKLNVRLSDLTGVKNAGKSMKRPSTASKPQSKSLNSSRNPDTSVASMSTYHSYATLDQEPMV